MRLTLVNATPIERLAKHRELLVRGIYHDSGRDHPIAADRNERSRMTPSQLAESIEFDECLLEDLPKYLETLKEKYHFDADKPFFISYSFGTQYGFSPLIAIKIGEVILCLTYKEAEAPIILKFALNINYDFVNEKQYSETMSLFRDSSEDETLTTSATISTMQAGDLYTTYCNNPQNQTILTLASEGLDKLYTTLPTYFFTDIDLKHAISIYTRETNIVSVFDQIDSNISEALFFCYRDKNQPNQFSKPFLLNINDNHWIALTIKINMHKKSAYVFSADSLHGAIDKNLYRSAILSFFNRITTLTNTDVHVAFKSKPSITQKDGHTCGAWAILNLLRMMKRMSPGDLSGAGRQFLYATCAIENRDALALKRKIVRSILTHHQPVAAAADSTVSTTGLFSARQKSQTTGTLKRPRSP